MTFRRSTIEDERRDFYRRTFNKEAVCDIAARRDSRIANLKSRLHDVERHTKALATCDEQACGEDA